MFEIVLIDLSEQIELEPEIVKVTNNETDVFQKEDGLVNKEGINTTIYR